MKKMNDKENNVWLFFAITLLWTWGFGFAPVLFSLHGTTLGTFLFYFGGGAPSVVGLFFVFFTYTKEKRIDYFKRCFHAPMPEMNFLKTILAKPYFLPMILFISIISGPLNEEFGWRGYSLDILMKKYGFFGSSALLGFIWAIWHLPWYFMPGQAQYELLQESVYDAFLFIPSTMLLSFVVSFVYIETNRSILAGAMTHMMSNLMTNQLLMPTTTEMSTKNFRKKI